MRLTLKLTLGILVGLALQLVVNVHLRVQRESNLLEGDVRKDHLVLGRALSIDLIEEWRDGGPDALLVLAKKMNAERAELDVTAVMNSDVPAEVARSLRGGVPHQSIRRIGDDERLVTWMPLSMRGELFAALMLEESLAPARAYVRNTLVRTAIWATLGFLITASLAWLLGFVIVGRPVRALAERRAASGRGTCRRR